MSGAVLFQMANTADLFDMPQDSDYSHSRAPQLRMDGRSDLTMWQWHFGRRRVGTCSCRNRFFTRFSERWLLKMPSTLMSPMPLHMGPCPQKAAECLANMLSVCLHGCPSETSFS